MGIQCCVPRIRIKYSVFTVAIFIWLIINFASDATAAQTTIFGIYKNQCPIEHGSMLSASDILILASIVSLGFVVGLLRKRATAPTKTIDYILRYSPRILLLSLLVLGGKILHGYLTFVVSCPPPIVATVISKELVDSTAASNIRRIAEEGDPFFQLQLGSLYANGNGAGIAQDYAAAYFWYSVAGKVSKFGEASKYMRDQITSYLSEDQAKAIRLKAEKWSPHENVPELKESE